MKNIFFSIVVCLAVATAYAAEAPAKFMKGDKVAKHSHMHKAGKGHKKGMHKGFAHKKHGVQSRPKFAMGNKKFTFGPKRHTGVAKVTARRPHFQMPVMGMAPKAHAVKPHAPKMLRKHTGKHFSVRKQFHGKRHFGKRH